jgi:uncharacterized small protein (DUF1192 family)
MFDDDLEPRAKKPKPKDLSLLSVQDLEEYIAALEHEVVRAKEEIARRQKQKTGAEALFKR